MSERLIRIVENYEMRLRVDEAGHLSETVIRDRVERFRQASEIQDLQLDQVRQVLCSAGVATIMFPMYHAFARRLGKLSRQETTYETLQKAMMATLTTWEMRGLLRPVLLAIAAGVFNILPPDPVEGSTV